MLIVLKNSYVKNNKKNKDVKNNKILSENCN